MTHALRRSRRSHTAQRAGHNVLGNTYLVDILLVALEPVDARLDGVVNLLDGELEAASVPLLEERLDPGKILLRCEVLERELDEMRQSERGVELFVELRNVSACKFWRLSRCE